jgi:hypothetical protein
MDMVIHQTDSQHLDIVLSGNRTNQREENEKIPFVIKDQITIDGPLVDVVERSHLENPVSSLHIVHTLRFLQRYNAKTLLCKYIFIRGRQMFDNQRYKKNRLRQNAQPILSKTLIYSGLSATVVSR